MAPKRRGRAPPPPAPPPQESGFDDAEEPPRVPAAPQNPKRQVTRSSGKPPAPQLGDRALEEEEESGSSESEAVIPEPVPKKKAAAACESKPEEARKRSAVPEPAPSGKAKKAKTEAGKASPLPTTSKAKKPDSKLEKAKVDPSPSSNSQSSKSLLRTWSREDETKILGALCAHLKSDGVLPKTEKLIALVGNRLDRKTCSYSDMYEKVRALKKRYEKALDRGTVPSNQEDLQIYYLSEAVWGAKGKEAIAAATSQSDSAMKKRKKGQGNKEKADGNSKGAAQEEANTSTANQNHGALKAGKRGHEEEKRNRSVKSRDFTELQNLYSNLSVFVGAIEAQHSCGQILKRAFEFIDDEEACALESKIEKQRVAKAKAQNCRGVITKDVRNLLIVSMAGQKI